MRDSYDQDFFANPPAVGAMDDISAKLKTMKN